MKPKTAIYSLLGVGVLVAAGFMIANALGGSLVYFVLPSEYASAPHEYRGDRLRLGGVVENDSIAFDDAELQLTFRVTDTLQSYPVTHRGTPPELFEENTGVVVEGAFDARGETFVADTVLIKHSEVYEAPAEGEPIDLEALKDTLQ